jgi:hypothetical protein
MDLSNNARHHTINILGVIVLYLGRFEMNAKRIGLILFMYIYGYLRIE